MKTKGKILYLESIRGLAALCVVIAHLLLLFYPALVLARQIPSEKLSLADRLFSKPPFPIFFNGPFSVVLFFVLSGFVLSYPYFKTFSPEVLCSATIRRYFRLAIPVAFSVLVCFVAWRAGWMKSMEASLRMQQDPNWIKTPHDNWVKEYFQFTPTVFAAVKESFVDAFFKLDEFRSFNPALWTMEIELKGSFLVYAFLAVFARMRRRYIVYIVMALGLYLAGGKYRYYPNFLFGCALCDYMFFSRDRQEATLHNNSWPLPKALTILALGLLAGSLLLNSTKFTIIHSVGAVLIIAAALKSPSIQKWLDWKPLIFLGEISFCLYLLHGVVLATFASSAYLLARDRGVDHFAASGLAAVVGLLIALPLAWLSSKYVDRFAIQFSKNLFARFFPNRTVQKAVETPFLDDRTIAAIEK